MLIFTNFAASWKDKNATSLTNLFLKQYLPYFEIVNQIYGKNIAEATRNVEMNRNNLTSWKFATYKSLF